MINDDFIDPQFHIIRNQYETELQSLNIPNLIECEIHFSEK